MVMYRWCRQDEVGSKGVRSVGGEATGEAPE